jgi:hypothetical protein
VPAAIRQGIEEEYDEMPQSSRLDLLHRLEEKTCPECGSIDLREIDGQIICMNCAIEHNNGGQLKHFANDYFETDYSLGTQGKPATNLAFGRGNGDTLRRKDTFSVLAKGVGGKKNLGLRSRQIRIFQTSNEHPTIHSMLEIGSDLCEEFGMTGEDAVFFADHLGKKLRKVGNSALQQKGRGESIEIRRLTIATFVHVWQLMERDRGLRTQISFEDRFPGQRRIIEGTWEGKGIKSDQYKIRAKDWEFVLWSVMIQPNLPATKKPLMEDPQVLKLLQVGKLICKKWFGHNGNDTFGVWTTMFDRDFCEWKQRNPTICQKDVEVDGTNFFGTYKRNLLRIGAFWIGSDVKFPPKQYADAAFALTMKQQGEAEYLYSAERLNVEPNLMETIIGILESMK